MAWGKLSLRFNSIPNLMSAMPRSRPLPDVLEEVLAVAQRHSEALHTLNESFARESPQRPHRLRPALKMENFKNPVSAEAV